LAGAGQVAATVNGQVISELAVQRALRRVPPARHAEARPEIMAFLIDNQLIDQYLSQVSASIDPKEIEAKMQEMADEIKKDGATVDKVMRELMLSEAELRAQITAQLRWDKYVVAQGNEKVLRTLFDENRDMFDGTVVHARHILLTVPNADPRAGAEAKTHLVNIRKQIEEQVAQGMAKLPPQSDNLATQKARAKILEAAFIDAASKESTCPSKTQGGDLGWFPRSGNMVEPFAKAAFSLQPYQLSDVVTSPFGHHLILVVDRRPGKDVKFEDVKEEVREVFAEKLRDSLLARLRPGAKVVVNAPPQS
jgi:peptidyl-prolyl cis-trans isomerase C